MTTAAVIKGRSIASDLPTGWRVAVTVLMAMGILLAVVGLWQALAAQAGARPEAISLEDIHSRFGSVQAYQVAVALRAGRRLDFARYAVAAALGMLLVGIGLTWWAPAAPAASSHFEVGHARGSTCGTFESTDGDRIRISMPGRHSVTVDQADVTKIFVVDACPAMLEDRIGERA